MQYRICLHQLYPSRLSQTILSQVRRIQLEFEQDPQSLSTELRENPGEKRFD